MSADLRSRIRSAAHPRAAIALLLTILPFLPSTAQVAFRNAPEQLRAGESVNLFVEVGGSERIDGFVLALPAAWSLDAVRVVDATGRPIDVTTEPLVEYANRWLILGGGAPIRPESRLIVTVNPVSPSAAATAAVTPVRLSQGPDGGEPRILDTLRSRAELPVVPKRRTSLGRSADFAVSRRAPDKQADGSGRILPFDREQMPGPWESFTLDLWMKTTAFDEVVVSTWTGNDGDPYPFELMVDGAGHMVAYQGTGDHHVSMRSKVPVADGSWHHVAVVHDTPAGWTRLVINGESADSLVHRRSMTFERPTGLALGERPGSDRTLPTRAYTGQLDELRLRPEALSVSEIRRSKADPGASVDGDGLAVSFDEDAPVEVTLVDDSPYHRHGIADLDVRPGAGGVTIVWTAAGTDAERFVVERSTDGLHFTEAGQVQASLPPEATYSIVDQPPGDGVMFYRLREIMPGGEERISDAVKVGMGDPDRDLTVVLTGSFPNPFNPVTRISYTVRETQYVRLSVWDLSGQMVTMLVDETVTPGYHEVSFDAEGLPSGTYFVRLNTSEGTQTHQMVLMK